jgi:hypothetical protein
VLISGGRSAKQPRVGKERRRVKLTMDAKQVGNLNFGQLTDYIGVVGLAQINLDKPLGDAPTILKLFGVPKDERRQEMTA